MTKRRLTDIPLNTFRFFEAVARHLHLKNAAEELCVTYSAVSHQIRSLERVLGVTLFNRTTKPLTLTREGVRLYKTISAVFDDLDRVTADLVDTETAGEMHISCAPSLALTWLVPALGQLVEEYPHLQLHLTTAAQLTSLEQKLDLAICYGEPKELPGWRIVTVAYANLFPVASPSLLATGQEITAPEDLLRFTLLHEDDGTFWTRWFTSAGVQLSATPPGLFLSKAHLAMTGALEGYGVAIIDSILGKNDVQSGRLVRLFEHVVPMPYPYYLVAPAEGKMAPAAKALENMVQTAFKKWCQL
ncbi:LysR substrate-binding domain-containing protein [Desulfogranum japonicum]|uniref:LysR substrate-binding domain-containing protein n=1 Tax=Desulfogranum japonicum TaxID=231447 RepID=UPI00041B71A6|nr:LysR substrate-binding domain-containing protein [Desulfogranum japonicum]